MKVVLIGGHARAGKNTAALALTERGYVETSFALPIRKMVYTYFGLDKTRLGDKEYEDSVTLPGNKSVRDALIYFGESARAFWPHIWAVQCLRRVDALVHEGKDVVVTDLRRINEAQIFQTFHGMEDVELFYIYISNPSLPIHKKTFLPFMKVRNKLYASSVEREVGYLRKCIERHNRGFVLINNRSKSVLHKQVEEIVDNRC